MRDKHPHQHKDSKCRAGAGPPQARHPGGENRPELGQSGTNVTREFSLYPGLSPLFLWTLWLWLDPNTYQAML